MGYMDDHFKEGDTCTGCCTNWITLGIVFLTLSTVEYKVLIGGGIHGIGETHKHQDQGVEIEDKLYRNSEGWAHSEKG